MFCCTCDLVHLIYGQFDVHYPCVCAEKCSGTVRVQLPPPNLEHRYLTSIATSAESAESKDQLDSTFDYPICTPSLLTEQQDI